MERRRFDIAVLAGDGIGPEVMAPCVDLLERAARRCGGFDFAFEPFEAGARTFRERGVALPEESLAGARGADAILLGAMGLPEVRYRDGTEISPQLDLRFALDLYAGVRPVRAVPGVPGPLSDPRGARIDLVLIRESTEGLFASYARGEVLEDREARDTLVITRKATERVADFALALAARRKRDGGRGVCTCVDKANVFRSYAFFRRVFDERARAFPEVRAEHAYVDATALDLTRRPWRYDVLVTENMFGDILSDLGAGLIGGMGMAPSADIGADHALFQPCHGSAPDIAGSGRANPAAMILSGSMMLEWLGERHALPACTEAARLLRGAVDRAFGDGGLVPTELGGTAGTDEIHAAVAVALDGGPDGP